MTLLSIIITAIFIMVAGLSIIKVFGFLEKSSFIEKLSYSWGLGVGLIAIQMFIYSLLNISWNHFSLLFPWFAIFALLLIRKKIQMKIKPVTWRLSMPQFFFAGLIILLLIFTGFESVLRPIQAWDGWGNWILRAKVFYSQNNLSLDYVNYTSDDYPIIMPLMSTFGYIMIDNIDDKNILFLHYMFYLALGGIFFTTAKKLFTTQMALILTFLLLSVQNIIRHGGRFEVGQSDLALGYYIFAAAMLLYTFFQTKNTKTLFLFSIFAGITGQIKNDGMAFFLISNCIAFLLIIFWKKYKYLFYLIPGMLFIILWQSYKYLNDYPTNILLRSGVDIHFDKLGAIVIAMLQEFINFQNWSILWIIFFITIILKWDNLKKVAFFLAIFFLLYISIMIIYP